MSGISDAVAGVHDISLHLQPVQDIQIDTRLTRTQYQYVLQHLDEEELRQMDRPAAASAAEAAGTGRRHDRPARPRPADDDHGRSRSRRPIRPQRVGDRPDPLRRLWPAPDRDDLLADLPVQSDPRGQLRNIAIPPKRSIASISPKRTHCSRRARQSAQRRQQRFQQSGRSRCRCRPSPRWKSALRRSSLRIRINSRRSRCHSILPAGVSLGQALETLHPDAESRSACPSTIEDEPGRQRGGIRLFAKERAHPDRRRDYRGLHRAGHSLRELHSSHYHSFDAAVRPALARCWR